MFNLENILNTIFELWLDISHLGPILLLSPCYCLLLKNNLVSFLERSTMFVSVPLYCFKERIQDSTD